MKGRERRGRKCVQVHYTWCLFVFLCNRPNNNKKYVSTIKIKPFPTTRIKTNIEITHQHELFENYTIFRYIPFNWRPSWSHGLFSSTHIICRLTIAWLFSNRFKVLSSAFTPIFVCVLDNKITNKKPQIICIFIFIMMVFVCFMCLL